jgi:hypothetical protein
MKCRNERGFFIEKISEAFPHLTRRFIGKGDPQDAGGWYSTFCNQVLHAVHYHTCLAGTGAGKDQQRALPMEDSLTLRLIEVSKVQSSTSFMMGNGRVREPY